MNCWWYNKTSLQQMCSHPKKRCQIKNVLHVNLIFYFIQLSSTVFNKRELTPYFFQLRNLPFIKLNTLFVVSVDGEMTISIWWWCSIATHTHFNVTVRQAALRSVRSFQQQPVRLLQQHLKLFHNWLPWDIRNLNYVISISFL